MITDVTAAERRGKGREQDEDWREVVDEESGMVYYWEVFSNRTSWEPPSWWEEKNPSQHASSRAREGGEEEEEEREEDIEVQRVMGRVEPLQPATPSPPTATEGSRMVGGDVCL